MGVIATRMSEWIRGRSTPRGGEVAEGKVAVLLRLGEALFRLGEALVRCGEEIGVVEAGFRDGEEARSGVEF